jgi:hypothetical protein
MSLYDEDSERLPLPRLLSLSARLAWSVVQLGRISTIPWDGDRSITAPHAEHIGPERLRTVMVWASGMPGQRTTMVAFARWRRASWIAAANLITPGPRAVRSLST